MVVQFNAFMVIFFSLHLRLVDLLHLWLKVVAFVVSVTFMVNSYYTYGWYNIYVFITFVGDTSAFNTWKSNKHFVDVTCQQKTISPDRENHDGGLQGNGFCSPFSSLRFRINPVNRTT